MPGRSPLARLAARCAIVLLAACRAGAPEPAPVAPPAPAPVVAPAPAVATPAPAEVASGDRPPAVVVQRGICPGECCTYREWTATAPVDVVDAPGGARVVARLATGEAVAALTGEVHATPRPARVRVARAVGEERVPVTVGQRIWTLAPVGEGIAFLWIDGRIVQDEGPLSAEDCPDCWVAFEPGVEWGQDPWWVQVRTAGGATGWVDNTRDVLTGFDACG